jgi:hypothetical protein
MHLTTGHRCLREAAGYFSSRLTAINASRWRTASDGATIAALCAPLGTRGNGA